MWSGNLKKKKKIIKTPVVGDVNKIKVLVKCQI